MSSLVSKESAALKIQRVFRGFLVRKSVKKISSIRFEVCEIEMRINDTETVDLIRRDAKERLRVNETLMCLLFKLDSIRGVDFGVRDFRKVVIRKAIALQEKIDSIVAAKNGSAEIGSEIASEIAFDHVPESLGFRDEVVDVSMKLTADTDSVTNADGVIDSTIEVLNEISVNCNPDEVIAVTIKLAADSDSVMNADGVIDATMEVLREIDVNCNPNECSEDEYAFENTETDNKKRNIELLDKLMDDNEKMMKLMKQMFERNELQTRMLNSLSQRVELLEKKAFIGDKSRKKKKMQSSYGHIQ